MAQRKCVLERLHGPGPSAALLPVGAATLPMAQPGLTTSSIRDTDHLLGVTGVSMMMSGTLSLEAMTQG